MESSRLYRLPPSFGRPAISTGSGEETSRGRKLAFDEGLKVGELMVGNVRTVTPETSALDAARILLEKRIGCLVAVNESHEPVGIITESDFLELAVKALESFAAGKRAGGDTQVTPKL